MQNPEAHENLKIKNNSPKLEKQEKNQAQNQKIILKKKNPMKSVSISKVQI